MRASNRQVARLFLRDAREERLEGGDGAGKIEVARGDLAAACPKPPGAIRIVEQKFEALCQPLLPKRQVRAILDALWGLENTKNVGCVAPMFEV